MTRDQLEQLLDEYARLTARHTTRGPRGTYTAYRPSAERRARVAEIRKQILDAVAPE
ncbi:hypothetical protein ACIBJE_02000 [Micromonospora sp. NPDC050187]|uniref:hypothetical protein n=1 Tax=Micromonospora sp. NPDC050187 TaxID=3364277 RepID=UPI00379FFEB4